MKGSIDAGMFYLGRAVEKLEGGTVALDPMGIIDATTPHEDLPDQSEWVELSYDPADEVNEAIFGTITRILDGNDLATDEIEAIVTKIAYTYCRARSGFED